MLHFLYLIAKQPGNLRASGSVGTGDGARRLYANGAWRGDDEVGRLMADFSEADPDKIHNRLLADR